MFNNPGAKLQSLARFVCTLIILAAVIGAFILFGITKSAGLFILIVVAGVIMGWLNSIVLYAFGTIVQRLEDITRQTNDIRFLLESLANVQYVDEQEDRPE